MHNAPKISFVLAARNDDYGRNFLNRMRTSIRVLAELTERNRAAFELVVVEYCPPVDQPSLIEALADIQHPALPIRIITVPPSFHDRVRGESKNPFLEYIAKNVGIRRAHGEYIIATNPDIIFNNSFVQYVATTILDPHAFYRVNRHDLNIRIFDEHESTDSILDRCESATTRIWTSRGQRYVSWKRWWQRLMNHLHPFSFMRNLLMCPLFNMLRKNFDEHRPHDAAAGDFIMAHRDAWAHVGGYDQAPVNSHTDGYNVYMFLVSGFLQRIIHEPMYHMNHNVINSAKFQISDQEYLANIRKMLKTGMPYKTHSEDWGFPDESFQEVIL